VDKWRFDSRFRYYRRERWVIIDVFVWEEIKDFLTNKPRNLQLNLLSSNRFWPYNKLYFEIYRIIFLSDLDRSCVPALVKSSLRIHFSVSGFRAGSSKSIPQLNATWTWTGIGSAPFLTLTKPCSTSYMGTLVISIMKTLIGWKAGGAKKRGMSMLQELPRSRTCKEAGIPDRFCICDKSVPIETNQTMVWNGAQFAVRHMNLLIQRAKFGTAQQHLLLFHVFYVPILKSWNLLLFYKNWNSVSSYPTVDGSLFISNRHPVQSDHSDQCWTRVGRYKNWRWNTRHDNHQSTRPCPISCAAQQCAFWRLAAPSFGVGHRWRRLVGSGQRWALGSVWENVHRLHRRRAAGKILFVREEWVKVVGY